MSKIRSDNLKRATKKKSIHWGYTLVEVMVALAVLAVGVTGILSMENAAILANRRAQEITTATNIARLWQERVRLDSLTWNRPSQRNAQTDLATDTQFLCALVGCTNSNTPVSVGKWFVPLPRNGGLESAGFDAFGNETTLGSPLVKYCVNLRFTWLRQDSPSRQGLVRSEVRVWWYREGVSRNADYVECGMGSDAALAGLGGDIETLHFVSTVTTVSGNPL